MLESSKEVGEGTSVAAAPPPEVSVAPVEKEERGTLLEDALQEIKGSALK